MSEISIRCRELSKRYRIDESRARYSTLRETLMSKVLGPLKRRNGKSAGDSIWALKGVNFEVEQGEILGIIGHNGAGKSTLLKVLSRITRPTEGWAELHGRVGSLLEVGTGFHPELTGRENIFLNGAILGMKKTEIIRNFDAIVAFAEVEKFINTPVKRYSSGMYMRLAFAVASHMEPEILLVDEVLAVGDAAFQKKCLGKMGDVAKAGRTVVFVSHNTVAVQSLCKRALWFDNGEIVMNGTSGEVISEYLHQSFAGSAADEENWPDIACAPGNDSVRLHALRVRAEQGNPGEPLTMKTPLAIEVEYWNLLPDAQLNITLHLYTENGIMAFSTGNGNAPDWQDRRIPVGLFRSVCHVPGDLLNAGRHRFVVLVVRDRASVIYQHDSALSFEILDLGGREVGWYGREPGIVQPALNWTTENIGETPGL
jgi:lipopolysaccharide transport system ATP-binding protein